VFGTPWTGDSSSLHVRIFKTYVQLVIRLRPFVGICDCMWEERTKKNNTKNDLDYSVNMLIGDADCKKPVGFR
jgi:hypothetical protein